MFVVSVLNLHQFLVSSEFHQSSFIYYRNSIGIVTALNPIIGYKNSTKIAKEAMATGKGVYDLVLEHDILSKEDLDTILKPENMVEPVKLDIKPKKQL